MPDRKLWKWLLCLAVFSILAIIGALTLIFSLTALVSWSGHREWDETRQALLARGEKLSVDDFVPPPVPDDQNFFSDSMWAELTDLVPSGDSGDARNLVPRKPLRERQLFKLDPHLSREEIGTIREQFPAVEWYSKSTRRSIAWQILDKYAAMDSEAANRATAGYVLQLLVPCAPMIDRIAELAKRPYARFPARYHDDFYMALPHLGYLLNCARILGLRARTHLTGGDPDQAFQDLVLLLHLQYTIGNEPVPLSLSYRTAMNYEALTAIDLGIRDHEWNAERLSFFENTLSTFNPARDFARDMRFERCSFNEMTERIFKEGDFGKLKAFSDSAADGTPPDLRQELEWRLYGTFFFRRDEAWYNNVLQHQIDNYEAASRSGFVSDNRAYDGRILRMRDVPAEAWAHTVSLLNFPYINSVRRKVDLSMTHMALTSTACALERYLLQNGFYPLKLSELVPEFIPAIPKDPMNGKPLNYRRTAPDKFLLYSVGWDRVDNGGVPVIEGEVLGDWVWGTPLL